MQETITTTPDDELPPSRPRRFRLIALGLALLLFAPFAYVAYQNIADAVSDPSPNPNPGLPEPDFSLTDEEAIARFDDLHATALEAARSRDLTLVPSLFTQASPMKERLIGEIQKLQQENVLERSSFDRQRLQVTSNTAREIRLLEVTTYMPCFKSESGKDVTVGPPAIRQEVEWVLELEGSTWLINESVIRADKKVADLDGPC